MTRALPNPFGSITTIDSDKPITVEMIENLITETGTTILIRSEKGHPRRGGYYFQVRRTTDGLYSLTTFDHDDSFEMSIPMLVAIINHCAGLKYNEDAYLYCRDTINLKSD